MRDKKGSSGKRVPGIVEVIELEPKVFHVTEAIGLPLELAIPMSADLTDNMMVRRFNRKNKGITEDLSTAMRDAFDAKGMVLK